MALIEAAISVCGDAGIPSLLMKYYRGNRWRATVLCNTNSEPCLFCDHHFI